MTDCDLPESIDLNDLLSEIKETLKLKSSDPNGPTYKSLRKLNAKSLLNAHRDVEATYNFVEAIAPSIRTMATYRYEKNICDNDKKKKIVRFKLHKDIKKSNLLDNCDELLSGLALDDQIESDDESVPSSNTGYLDKSYIKHVDDDDETNIHEMKKRLKEFPDEWTIIQLTAGYDPCEQWEIQRVIKSSVKEFYITILKSCFMDMNNIETFNMRISPDKENYGLKPLFEELHSTLEENLKVIENGSNYSKNVVQNYWDQRTDCDLRMRSVIAKMDKEWLGPWKCLLNGKILSKTLREEVYKYVDNLCSENRTLFSPLQKMLLYMLFSSAHFVSSIEASLSLRKIYIDYSRFLYEKNSFDKYSVCENCKCNSKVDTVCINCWNKTMSASSEFKKYKKAFMAAFDKIKSEADLPGLKRSERGPVILLLDEKLDIFPWEVLPTFCNQSVTRIECLSFAYALFKKHSSKIHEGYFLLKPDDGKFLINPGNDLKRMEIRMNSFMNYWCPQWKGEINKPSSLDIYQQYLQESDVFLYCGHGDGSQYMKGGAERLSSVKAVAILSGCGSVGLRHPGTRLLPDPTHSYFHTATCPCVIGMLWEVTDLEVDKVTSMLLSLFLPSKAPKAWGNVGKAQWVDGILDPTSSDKSVNFELRSNLLRALAVARRSTSYTLIAASVVSRGLPIKIDPNFIIK